MNCMLKNQLTVIYVTIDYPDVEESDASRTDKTNWYRLSFYLCSCCIRSNSTYLCRLKTSIGWYFHESAGAFVVLPLFVQTQLALLLGWVWEGNGKWCSTVYKTKRQENANLNRRWWRFVDGGPPPASWVQQRRCLSISIFKGTVLRTGIAKVELLWKP